MANTGREQAKPARDRDQKTGRFVSGRNPTGGRPKGARNRFPLATRVFFARIMESPQYRQRVGRELLAGTLHPVIEAKLIEGIGRIKDGPLHEAPEFARVIRAIADVIAKHVTDPAVLEAIRTDVVAVLEQPASDEDVIPALAVEVEATNEARRRISG